MSDDLVEKARNSVFQKIGRNVCNLQKVEGLMKVLVILSNGANGTAGTVKACLLSSEESLKKKSMGLVAKDMFQSVFGKPEDIAAPDTLNEPWISFKQSIELEKKHVEALQQALSIVIEERNNLIHPAAAKNDLKTIVGCRKFADELEVQNERIKSIHSTLRGLVESMLEARKTITELMETDEFWVLFQGVEARENEGTPIN